MEFRDRGKSALETVLLNKKNIEIFERNIFEISKKDDNPELEKIYFQYIFQIISDIQTKRPLKLILADIKKQKIGWGHSSFDEIRFKRQEKYDFITKPFEVEEGVVECACGSKRTFSYSKQCRGCDESATTFTTCVECNRKWSCSN